MHVYTCTCIWFPEVEMRSHTLKFKPQTTQRIEAFMSSTLISFAGWGDQFTHLWSVVFISSDHIEQSVEN